MLFADMIGSPESASSFLPSSSLVPFMRTTSGTVSLTSRAAVITPLAITSHFMMPPKILTRIAFRFGFFSMILTAWANFLDVGGGATAEKVTEAFKIMLKNPNLKAILVNIFGGIMKCDVIANGVMTAAREVKLTVPLVVRMKGTNEELGRKLLADSGLPIISANNMAEAAERVVAAAANFKAGK